MSTPVSVYYALQSPWTYLGWPRLLELAAEKDAELGFKPVKAGPLFAASGGLPLAKRPAQRRAYRMMELKRWREVLGLQLTLEPRFFPTDETAAALMVIAHGRTDGDIGGLSFAMLRAVWAEERDLADRDTLLKIAREQNADGDALLAAAATAAVRRAYDDNTQAAIDAGVFGVSTFALGTELFWGQDRLDLLARAMG